MIFSILPALLLIGAVVFIHELGHYLAARSIGLKVEKFSVCFGPRIFAFTSVKDGWDFKLFFYRKNEEGKIAWGPIFSKFFNQSGRKGSKTEYCLSLVPLGGYVKVAGMLDESLDTKISKNSMINCTVLCSSCRALLKLPNLKNVSLSSERPTFCMRAPVVAVVACAPI